MHRVLTLCDTWRCVLSKLGQFLPWTGLDSDESCEGLSEASFKDARGFDGSIQKNNGSVPQENGIRKHRYSFIPAPHSTLSGQCFNLSGLSSLQELQQRSFWNQNQNGNYQVFFICFFCFFLIWTHFVFLQETCHAAFLLRWCIRKNKKQRWVWLQALWAESHTSFWQMLYINFHLFWWRDA